MKGAKGKIFIFITFMLMGFFIISNIHININKIPNVLKLNSLEYKKAIEERTKLFKDIENIKEKNISYSNKIYQYKNHDGKSNKIVEDMKNQLSDYNMLMGGKEIKGPGVIIKVEDGDINTKVDSSFETWRKILHDNDMALVLNEVRNAGAEAIVINDHRILNSSAVRCRWAFIGFEDQTMEYAPFYIYAIGDPEQMKTTLLAEGSYIQKLILRTLKVDIKAVDEIIIPSTKQKLPTTYMERYFPQEK